MNAESIKDFTNKERTAFVWKCPSSSESRIPITDLKQYDTFFYSISIFGIVSSLVTFLRIYKGVKTVFLVSGSCGLNYISDAQR